jgi:hypothetical protein
VSEAINRPVGRNKQLEDIEALGTRVGYQARIETGVVVNELGCLV